MYLVAYRERGTWAWQVLQPTVLTLFFDKTIEALEGARSHKDRHPDHEVYVWDLGRISVAHKIGGDDYRGEFYGPIFEALQSVGRVDTVEHALVDGEEYVKVEVFDADHDYVVRIEKVEK